MLLDRHKVKFWQKIVFSVMALLMAGFLIAIPLAGQSCGSSSQSGVSEQLQKDITRYKAATKADPTNVQAWRNLADAYVSSVSASRPQGTVLTSAQAAKLAQAAVAYRKASSLLEKQKGASAKAQRVDTLELLANVYDTVGNYSQENSVLGELTGLKPNNADYFFRMGNVAMKAGDTKGALLAFQRFVDLAPNDPLTPDVKAFIKKNAPKATPAPTSTKGTGQ